MKKKYKNIFTIGSLLFIIFSIITCKENSITCEYQFQSLATGRVIKSQYNFKVKNNEQGYFLSYKNDIETFKYEINRQKRQMRIFFDSNFDDVAFYVGEKQFYNNNKKKIIVECYKVDNDEKLGGNLLIFCNQHYGILLMKYTGYIRELISFNNESNYIESIIGLIKKDTTFYNLGH